MSWRTPSLLVQLPFCSWRAMCVGLPLSSAYRSHERDSAAMSAWRARTKGVLAITLHGRLEILNGICLAGPAVDQHRGAGRRHCFIQRGPGRWALPADRHAMARDIAEGGGPRP